MRASDFCLAANTGTSPGRYSLLPVTGCDGCSMFVVDQAEKYLTEMRTAMARTGLTRSLSGPAVASGYEYPLILEERRVRGPRASARATVVDLEMDAISRARSATRSTFRSTETAFEVSRSSMTPD